jgi:hypothetical protein
MPLLQTDRVLSFGSAPLHEAAGRIGMLPARLKTPQSVNQPEIGR